MRDNWASPMAGGKVNWFSHFGKHLAVSYKVTHRSWGWGRAGCQQEMGSFWKSGMVLYLLCGGSYTTL